VTNPIESGVRLLAIFDGQCGLCNRAVRWLIRRDRRDRLRFEAFDAPAVAGLLARHGIGAAGAGPETILAVRDAGGPSERLLARSDAVLALLRELPQPWPFVSTGLRWIPRPARDFGYRWIARWRYRIGGRLKSCPIPTVGERERFL